MKRISLLLLSVLLLCSVIGCTVPNEQPETAAGDMIAFYYRLSQTQFASQTGVISSELRKSPEDELLLEWLNEYLDGPLSSELQSPFPKTVIALSADISGSLINIKLSESYSALNGINLTIANACITLTLTQLEGIEAVSIESIGDSVATQEKLIYTASDFAEFDYSSEAVEVSLKLYYADQSYRYLLSAAHLVESGHSDRMPEYVVEQLVSGPTDDVMKSVMPEGTHLIDSSVDNGVCTLNFNQAFYDNRPSSESRERALIYSIVNSVTGLSGIDAVRFEIEGSPIGIYRFMDLSLVYTFCDDLVGPVRTAVNEFDSTVYMQGADDELLSAMPLRIRRSASEIDAEAFMRTLLTYSPPTGLRNPIPAGTKLLGIHVEDSQCNVDLSDEFLSKDIDVAMRCVVLSLSSLDEIDQVQILVNGESYGGVMRADASWCYPDS